MIKRSSNNPTTFRNKFYNRLFLFELYYTCSIKSLPYCLVGFISAMLHPLKFERTQGSHNTVVISQCNAVFSLSRMSEKARPAVLNLIILVVSCSPKQKVYHNSLLIYSTNQPYVYSNCKEALCFQIIVEFSSVNTN